MRNNKEQDNKLMQFLEKKLSCTTLSPDFQKTILIAADILINLVIVVFLVLFIRTFLISPFQVYGISMCNTLNYYDGKCQDTYGDYIIINKSSYLHLPWWTLGNPVRGDIVVFHPPQDNSQFYIKRIIGLPGETVKLVDGYVYIFNQQNPAGVKLDEPYLTADNLGGTYATGGISEFKVPEGKYFVLGDNRKHSSDSRICFKESPGSPGCGEKDTSSFLALDHIEGKAALALWPNPRILQTYQYKALK